MPEISVEIEIFCACGNGICKNSSAGRTRGRGQPFFEVSPCEKCLEQSKDEGYEDGYSKGYEEARKEFEQSRAVQGE